MQTRITLPVALDQQLEGYERCFDALEQARLALRGHPGVLGLGIGPRQRAGALVPAEPCLIIYVAQKQPLDVLPARELLPRQIGGVPTDVVVPGDRKNDIHNTFDARWLNVQ